jgi:septum formation protein
MSVTVVLASKSVIRRRILIDAGLDVDVVSPGVNEDAIKAKLAGQSAEVISQALAEAKARAVSLRRVKDWVIGADLMLRMEGKLYDKVSSIDAAEKRLQLMRGRPHELIGAVALAHAGEIRGAHVDVARLEMREFSDAFLRSYLDRARAGEGILASVGCYEYETIGAQLFERVDGDFFTILGLPLLPLLSMLRAEAVLAA